MSFSKTLVLVNCLVPGALLAWDWWRGQLGADPLNFITRSTGTLTLVFLLITLAVTPARKLTGANWLVKYRRTVGLYAFFYGAAHLLAYVWFDKAFDLRAVASDVAQRRFILVGVLAFTLMVPLAVTSTNKMIKRLGGKRWARLHRLVYASAVAGVLHFYLLVKADTTKPLLFAAALALLLGYRFIASQRQAPTSLGIIER
ncbi:MAG TPA: protein-methionine-sulfoxide reductase heme-binding subunit MsrQ [Pyrinomonadaceae bacterium]|nr:protein-methionine-sulfoxide reductase heme-binding subunit MsrQ [Pyrinomonadaceae bacterium]